MKPKRFTSMRKVQRWLDKNGKGRALQLITLHDDWCPGGKRGGCTCSPDFILEELTIDNVMSAAKADREWEERHKNN